MTKGAYAGPVTEGNTDVIVCRPPSSRSELSAGTTPRCIASSSVSGRAPSATMTITGTKSSGERQAGTFTFTVVVRDMRWQLVKIRAQTLE